jgi:hypothetical protein
MFHFLRRCRMRVEGQIRFALRSPYMPLPQCNPNSPTWRAVFLVAAVVAAVAGDAAADIRFTQPVATPAMLALTQGGGDGVIAVAPGDFNGDGHLDLAMALQVDSRGQVAIMLSTGLGGFFRPSPAMPVGPATGAAALPRGIAARDVDGDGRQDVLVASEELRQVLFFRGLGDGSLAAGVGSGTTHRPASLQVGDVNGDGRVDVVTGSYLDVSLSVLAGIGDGRFGAPTAIAMPAGRRPTGLVLDRLNGDTALDIAVSTAGSTAGTGTITTFLNTGTGQFGAAATPFTSTTGMLWGVWAADFTGDGLRDLAGMQASNGVLTLLPGAGNGTFGTPVTTAASIAGNRFSPQQVVDVDADGRPDIVFVTGVEADNEDNVVGVARNAGSGTFTIDYWVASAPGRRGGVLYGGDHGRLSSVAVGDFTADGRPDLVTAATAGATAQGFASGGVSIVANLGAGRFDTPRVAPFGGQGHLRVGDERLAIADFTGDGRADLAGVTFGSSSVQVLPGLTTGGWGAAIAESTPAYGTVTAQQMRWPVAADFDGDGRQDIVFYTSRAGVHGVSVLYGDGDGTFTDRGHHNTESGANGTAPVLASARIDGDARPDLISVPSAALARIDVLRYTGAPNGFTRTAAIDLSAFGGAIGGGVATGDVTGDGRTDLVARLTTTTGTDALVLVEGLGNGTFQAPRSIGSFGTSSTVPLSTLVLADVDGDGRLDLLGGGAFNEAPRHGGLVVRPGRGDGTFGPATQYAIAVAGLSTGPVDVIVPADLDGDARVDLLIGSRNAGMWTLQGRSDGTFKAPISHAVGRGSRQMALGIADLTGDARPEVLAAYLGNSNASRYAATSLVNLSRPFGVTPDRGGAGRVTLRLDGIGLTAGSSVRLTRVGEPDVAPIALRFDAATGDLIATFDLTGQSLGEWNVAILRPNGTVDVTLAAAFRVDPAMQANVWAEIVARQTVRLQRTTTFYVTYGNDGNVDATDLVGDVSLTGSVRLARLPQPLAEGVTVRTPGIVRPVHSSNDSASFHVPVVPAQAIITGVAVPVRTTELGPFTVEVSGLVRTKDGAFTPPPPPLPVYAISNVQVTGSSYAFRATPSTAPADAIDFALSWTRAGGPMKPTLEILPQGSGAVAISTLNVWVPDEVATELGLPVSGRAAAPLVVSDAVVPYNLQGNRGGSFYQVAERYTLPHVDPATGRLDGRSYQVGAMLRQVRSDLIDCLRDLGLDVDYDDLSSLTDQSALAHLGAHIVHQANAPGGVTSSAIGDYMAGQVMDALGDRFGADILVDVERGDSPVLAQIADNVRHTALDPATNPGISLSDTYAGAMDYASKSALEHWVSGAVGPAQSRLERQSREALNLFLARLVDYCFRCERDPQAECDPDDPPNPPTPPDPPTPPTPGPGRGPGGPGSGRGVRGSRFPGITLQAADPNDKVGPAGAGPGRHLRAGVPLGYTVYFENLETAGLPAADVVITDQLDPLTMDLATLALGPIAIGGQYLLTPPAGLQNWTTTLDLRPTRPLLVRIAATYAPTTHVLTWRFTTLDPVTGLPPDDTTLGFLPPNVNSPEGEGSVAFSVTARRTLQTGDSIGNGARIVFDANAPIDTPVWRNGIDETAPVATMTALAPSQATHAFTVTWSGTDAGSGIADYTIAVSDNGGAWQPWLRHTTATSATFTGDSGHTYRFHARARDRVGLEQAGDPVAQATTAVTAPVSSTDRDGDGLTDAWETVYGLDPTSARAGDGAAGDPDGDGVTNSDELRQQSHPRGVHTQYFAEGSNSPFFETRLALANPGGVAAHVLLSYLRADGTVGRQTVTIPGMRHATVMPEDLSGFATADFSTIIDSDVPVVAERLMTWTRATRQGSHAESAVRSPALVWYLAEGATSSAFQLFYLLENPGTAPVNVEVTYLRLAPRPPIVKRYVVGPLSRRTIFVNTEAPELAGTDVSGVVRALDGTGIIVERAMYLAAQGQGFLAGHAAAGVVQASRGWFFAEGATGSFFDMFLLLANPGPRPATVVLRYLRPQGEAIERRHTVAANSRMTINVELEAPELASAALSTIVSSDEPIVAERAMYWPWLGSGWGEGHVSAGTTETGTTWSVADGELGGPNGADTYVLIANTSDFAGEARVTLMREDGTPVAITLALPANSRTNVGIGSTPAFRDVVRNRRFGVLVESLGARPARIVVERATYANDSAGNVWAAGAGAVATRVR